MSDGQAVTETRLEQMIDHLRAQGFRLTPQRLAVLRVLATTDDHPSVEEIYEQVRPNFPMMSLATVYKTLHLLKEIGEVREISFSDGGSRYDGRPVPHPHLICLRCDSIRDLEPDPLIELAQRVGQQTGYRIEGQRLDFFGICPQCQAAD